MSRKFHLRGATLILLALCGVGANALAAVPAQPQRPSKVRELRDEAVAHYKSRRYFQAVRCLETALEVADDSEKGELKQLLARTRSALGVELFNSGEIRRAGESFRDALEAAEDSYAHFGLGFLHFIKLEDDLALEHLKRAFELEPEYQKTHKLLALIDYRQGRTAQALSKIEKACQLDPKDKEAKALYNRWKVESALTGKFLEKSRGNFTVRADPALSAQRYDEAFKKIERARNEVYEALQLKGTRKIVFILFSPDSFQKATGTFHWIGGLYDGQVKLPVPSGPDPTPEAVREFDEGLRHELAHAAIREICPECPNWLNEGIAQHFERKGRGEIVSKQLREGASRRIHFKDVSTRLWEVDNEDIARWTYLEGLGFVEFIVARFQEFRLRLLLDSISKEGSVSKAFELTYGVNLEKAEELWWQEILKSAPR